MADERKPQRSADELTDLRRSAIRVFTYLSVFTVVVDLMGRLFRDSTFHVDLVVYGFIGGTLLALLGLEGINKVLGK